MNNCIVFVHIFQYFVFVSIGRNIDRNYKTYLSILLYGCLANVIHELITLACVLTCICGLYWDLYDNVGMHAGWLSCACMCAHMLWCMCSYICMHVDMHWHGWQHILRPVWLCRYACKLTYMCMHGCIHAVMHALIHLYWRVWYCTSSLIYYAECMSLHITAYLMASWQYAFIPWNTYHENMHMFAVISILRYAIIVLISAYRILCIKSYWRIVVSHNIVHMVSHIKVCLLYWMFYASILVMRKFL